MARRDLDKQLAQPLGVADDEWQAPPPDEREAAQRERDAMMAAGFGSA